MKELNQNQGSQPQSASHNHNQTIPKQAVDIVDLANSVDVLSNMYTRQLELDAMTSGEGNLMSTQSAYLNIQMNRVFVCGKQDTGAELNTMPLNIYDQLKEKCQLELRPCNDINIVGYNKQPIHCIGKTSVTCQHGNIVKQTTFYVTSVADSKVLL